MQFDRIKLLGKWCTVALIILALIAYLVAGIEGWIPDNRKVGVGDLALSGLVLLTIAILVKPNILDRVEQVAIGSAKLQLRQLEKVREDVAELQFVLSMLVTDNERRHLENLAEGNTLGYKRREELIGELRRLRAIDLIRSKRYLNDMPSLAAFDLADFAKLTSRGQSYLQRTRDARPLP